MYTIEVVLGGSKFVWVEFLCIWFVQRLGLSLGRGTNNGGRPVPVWVPPEERETLGLLLWHITSNRIFLIWGISSTLVSVVRETDDEVMSTYEQRYSSVNWKLSLVLSFSKLNTNQTQTKLVDSTRSNNWSSLLDRPIGLIVKSKSLYFHILLH